MTDTPSEEQVREWLRLSEEATPGDWTVTARNPKTWQLSIRGPDGGYLCTLAASMRWKEGEPRSDDRDAALIAATRTAVPALCHALLDAWAELDPESEPSPDKLTANQYLSLQAWAEDPNRGPAATVFTAGVLRDAATAVERSLATPESED